MLEGRPFSSVQLDMIEALLPHVKVAVIVNDQDEQRHIQAALQQRASSSQISSSSDDQTNLAGVAFHLVKHDSLWMRDFGPIFLKSEHQGLPLKVVAFRWNVWDTPMACRRSCPRQTLTSS
jgi:agmatine/peptidylarginine deiminase